MIFNKIISTKIQLIFKKLKIKTSFKHSFKTRTDPGPGRPGHGTGPGGGQNPVGN